MPVEQLIRQIATTNTKVNPMMALQCVAGTNIAQ
jgi:hypothetical protein